MANRRLTIRINITIAPHILVIVDRAVERYGRTRSSVIREALQDWLRKFPPDREVFMVNGKVFSYGMPFDYYLDPDSTDQDRERIYKDFCNVIEQYRPY